MSEQNDHDLIIRLDTKLDILGGKVDDLSKNIVGRVDSLENKTASLSTTVEGLDEADTDKEARLRFIETKMWLAIGALTIIQFVIGYYMIIHYGNSPL